MKIIIALALLTMNIDAHAAKLTIKNTNTAAGAVTPGVEAARSSSRSVSGRMVEPTSRVLA